MDGSEEKGLYDPSRLNRLEAQLSAFNKEIEDFKNQLIIAVKNENFEKIKEISEEIKMRESWIFRIEPLIEWEKKLEEYDRKILECYDRPEKLAKTLSEMKSLEEKLDIIYRKWYDDISGIIKDEDEGKDKDKDEGKDKDKEKVKEYRVVKDWSKYWLADGKWNSLDIYIWEKIYDFNVKGWKLLYKSKSWKKWIKDLLTWNTLFEDVCCDLSFLNNWFFCVAYSNGWKIRKRLLGGTWDYVTQEYFDWIGEEVDSNGLISVIDEEKGKVNFENLMLILGN